MKRLIFLSLSVFISAVAFAQQVSMRVVQVSYSSADPDAGGPAMGSVVFRFEIMSTAVLQADGIGLSAAFQSANLMATPTNTTVALGPLAAAVGTGWTQQVDNRAGADIIGTISYGGQVFDKRMVVSYNMPPSGTPMTVPMVWSPYAQITYWTKGIAPPEGGYIINEPGTVVANNEISTDGGLTTFQMLSPNSANPTPLSSAALPVLFSKFEAKCSNTGTSIFWTTEQESNSSHFELQKSLDGSTWASFSRVNAAGNSATARNYHQTDLNAGAAFYRIKQEDKDGQFIYTDVARTNCQSKGITTLLYPVPAREFLNVVIKSESSVRTQLVIYDVHGKMARKMDVQVANGTNNFRINLAGLAAGEYLLRSNDVILNINKVFTVTR